MSLVLDGSAVVAWCFEDKTTPAIDALMIRVAESGAVVPAIWRLEIVNALVVAERRKKILPEKSAQFIYDLQRLSILIDLDGMGHIFSEVLNYSRVYQRSSYDASYLELAKRLGLPFATKDEPLKKAAEELGIPLFQP